MSSRGFPLPTRRSTTQLARALATVLEPGALLVLVGELGAGKTFLTRALARALGVPASERITSPTFTLVHELAARIPLLHADLYRIEEPRDLEPLGITARRDAGALLVVEWGEPFIDALGGDALVLHLAVRPTGERSATLTSTGPRSAEALARLPMAAPPERK